MNSNKWIKLFLRISLGAGFISASVDRLGFWPKKYAAWGNWDSFLEYTQSLLPYAPESLIPTLGLMATVLEVSFGILLIIGFKTELIAKLSGWLLLIFAISMAIFTGIKRPLDASVFTAAAAAFALSLMKDKFLELDNIFIKD